MVKQTKKSLPTAERIHCKSFNGAGRGTVLQWWQSPTPDKFFGADFALIQFDHVREPVWCAKQWIKKPGKLDRYEAFRNAPTQTVQVMVSQPVEAMLHDLARISLGQIAYMTGMFFPWSLRWSGLFSTLPVAEGTVLFHTLVERVLSDASLEKYEQNLVLDGTEYNKSQYKSTPSVSRRDLVRLLFAGMHAYWMLLGMGHHANVPALLGEALTRRSRALWARHEAETTLFEAPFPEGPTTSVFMSGISMQYHKGIGLQSPHPLITGTGY